MTKVIGATEDGPFRQLEWAVAQYEPIGFNPGLTSQFILTSWGRRRVAFAEAIRRTG
jgi:hypothetical protein